MEVRRLAARGGVEPALQARMGRWMVTPAPLVTREARLRF